MAQINTLALQIIEHSETKQDLFIPNFNSIFRDVLERYHKDFRAEGQHSYEYKAVKENELKGIMVVSVI